MFLPWTYEGLVPRIHVVGKAGLVVVVLPGRQTPKDFEDSLAAPDACAHLQPWH